MANNSEPMEIDKPKEVQTPRKAEPKTDTSIFVKSKVESYFKQLTTGCGRAYCDNFLCASNPGIKNLKVNANEAALISFNIVKNAKPGEFICENTKTGSNSSNSSSSAANVPFMDLTSFEALLNEAKATNNYTPIVRQIGMVFGSVQACAISFMKHPKKARLDGKELGMDFDSVRTFFSKVDEMPEAVQGSLSSSFERLFHDLKYANTSTTPILRVFLLLLEYPKLLVEQSINKLAGLVLSTIAGLPDSKQELLYHSYFSELPKQQYVYLLRCLQDHMALRIIEGGEQFAPTSDSTIISATKIIGILFDINKKTNRSYVSAINGFCNEMINENIDLRKNYLNWKKDKFSFCNYPFILSTEVKSKFLNIEAIIAQRQLREEALLMLAQGFVDEMPLPYFILKVRRSHLIEDSIDNIRAVKLIDANSLKKQLRVEFAGEEGIDEGGVKKEWFQLIVQDLFSLKYGMFIENDETRTHWFNQKSSDVDAFELLGMVFGLAIYNNVILDLHFPIYVYKKLCGVAPTMEDLKEVNPGLAKGLIRLLEFKGDASTLDLNFQVEFENFGSVETHNLIPDGDKIALTNENKQKYVDLYLYYVLHASIELQFAAFKKGFDSVMSLGPAMKLFEPEELQLVLCGSPQLNFSELEKGTRYDNGYTKDHKTIKFFWEAVHSMTLDEKKQFLFFTTGSDRSPIGGLGKLNLVITRQAASAGTNRLPTAHTCFNHLILPEYETKEKLEQMLKKAIANSTGFGLM